MRTWPVCPGSGLGVVHIVGGHTLCRVCGWAVGASKRSGVAYPHMAREPREGWAEIMARHAEGLAQIQRGEVVTLDELARTYRESEPPPPEERPEREGAGR